MALAEQLQVEVQTEAGLGGSYISFGQHLEQASRTVEPVRLPAAQLYEPVPVAFEPARAQVDRKQGKFGRLAVAGAFLAITLVGLKELPSAETTQPATNSPAQQNNVRSGPILAQSITTQTSEVLVPAPNLHPVKDLEVSPQAIDAVKKFEGFEPVAAPDPIGIPTVGYGHVVKDTDPDWIKNGLNKEQAHDLLVQDLNEVKQKLENLVNVRLTQSQLDAIDSFGFNVGTNALKNSKLLRLVNEGKYAEAGQEFLRWNMAGSQVLPGLTKRRNVEKELWNREKPVPPAETESALAK